jgi:hypothetical protein
MIPVNMAIEVAPLADIPSQTCTFWGCSGLATNLMGCPALPYKVSLCDVFNLNSGFIGKNDIIHFKIIASPYSLQCD